jgi:hypothetical protein
MNEDQALEKVKKIYDDFTGSFSENQQWAMPDFLMFMLIMDSFRQKGMTPEQALKTLRHYAEQLIKVEPVIEKIANQQPGLN